MSKVFKRGDKMNEPPERKKKEKSVLVKELLQEVKNDIAYYRPDIISSIYRSVIFDRMEKSLLEIIETKLNGLFES